VLQKFGIGINEASNGAFLPATVHRPLHTKAYLNAVNEALAKATTRQEAIGILQDIGRAIQAGGFP
jgi:hypothetical protein